jgi:DNA-binding MarR family transcriptional regulator
MTDNSERAPRPPRTVFSSRSDRSGYSIRKDRKAANLNKSVGTLANLGTRRADNPALGECSILPLSVEASRPQDAAIPAALAGAVGYLLRRAHLSFYTYWMATFHSSDTPITPAQAGMLVVLAANPGLSQASFARMMSVEGPTLTQSIDLLESHGYLLRQRRGGDRRSNSLQLTPRGHQVLIIINNFVPIREADLMADLSQHEVNLLVGILTKIVRRSHDRFIRLALLWQIRILLREGG